MAILVAMVHLQRCISRHVVHLMEIALELPPKRRALSLPSLRWWPLRLSKVNHVLILGSGPLRLSRVMTSTVQYHVVLVLRAMRALVFWCEYVSCLVPPPLPPPPFVRVHANKSQVEAGAVESKVVATQGQSTGCPHTSSKSCLMLPKTNLAPGLITQFMCLEASSVNLLWSPHLARGSHLRSMVRRHLLKSRHLLRSSHPSAFLCNVFDGCMQTLTLATAWGRLLDEATHSSLLSAWSDVFRGSRGSRILSDPCPRRQSRAKETQCG